MSTGELLRPCAAFDTSALSEIGEVGDDALWEAAQSRGVVLAVPHEAFAELLRHGADAGSAVDVLRRLTLHGGRLEWLPGAVRAVGLELGFAGDGAVEAETSVIAQLLAEEPGSPAAMAYADELLAKAGSREADRLVLDDARQLMGGLVDPAERDAFVAGLPETAFSTAAWAAPMVIRPPNGESPDSSLLRRSPVATAFVVAAHVHAMGNVSRPGGRYAHLFRGHGKNANGWVDARIVAASSGAALFVSNDRQQRLVFQLIVDKVHGSQARAVSLDEFLGRGEAG